MPVIRAKKKVIKNPRNKKPRSGADHFIAPYKGRVSSARSAGLNAVAIIDSPRRWILQKQENSIEGE